VIAMDVLDWLLEEDADNPAVRYFALTDLLHLPADSPEATVARQALMNHGPVPAILAAQEEEGFWVKPGAGYAPKYRGTVWSVTYLAQLGADPADARVRAGGAYVLANSLASNGVFSVTGAPSASIHCLSGNLGRALQDLDLGADPRLRRALELLARLVVGEDVAPGGSQRAALRYYASGTCGPGFCCAANDKLPCAWGAVKVLRALARVPEAQRQPVVRLALRDGVEFLLSVDPATAGYPAGYSDRPSSSWFKFGFPIFYVADVLQVAEALAEAGHAADPRLAATYDFILSKRDKAGRWKMEYSYAGKTWSDIEHRGQPSKWVTLRAMRLLKMAGIEV
jgi:hypothetical protein